MSEVVRILHAEDVPSDAELAAREVRRVLGTVELCRVETEEAFLEALAAFSPHLVISDYRMPRFDGLRALRLTLQRAPDVPVVILTGAINEDTAVECMKAGAADYVIKEHLKRLGQAVVNALEAKRHRLERRQAEEEKVRLEEQLRQAQKLESVGRLAGGIAHDFNNMLAVILAAADALELQLPSTSPLREEVSAILQAAGRSRDITRQLLAFSRKEVAEPRSVEANRVVADGLRVLSRLIGEGVRVAFDPAPDLWESWIDPSQLHQILMNLVVNARDAMPGGGAIHIRTANVHVGEEEARRAVAGPGDYVRLSVQDHGVGMDADVLEHLFEPFFTTKGPGQGTGLGLSTVYGILRQSGGFVTVSSQPGRGSTFEVHVPRSSARAERREADQGVAAPITGTVLLVEDSDLVRESVSRMLGLLGYEVLKARHAEEALALCQAGTPFDVLFTDVVLPGMDGVELRDRVRALRRDVPVLLTSGHAEDVVSPEWLLQPGVHFIQKPFGIREVAAKLREVRERAAGQAAGDQARGARRARDSH